MFSKRTCPVRVCCLFVMNSLYVCSRPLEWSDHKQSVWFRPTGLFRTLLYLHSSQMHIENTTISIFLLFFLKLFLMLFCPLLCPKRFPHTHANTSKTVTSWTSANPGTSCVHVQGNLSTVQQSGVTMFSIFMLSLRTFKSFFLFCMIDEWSKLRKNFGTQSQVVSAY